MSKETETQDITNELRENFADTSWKVAQLKIDALPEPESLEMHKVLNRKISYAQRWLYKPSRKLDTAATAILPEHGGNIFEARLSVLATNGFYIRIFNTGPSAEIFNVIRSQQLYHYATLIDSQTFKMAIESLEKQLEVRNERSTQGEVRLQNA